MKERTELAWNNSNEQSVRLNYNWKTEIIEEKDF